MGRLLLTALTALLLSGCFGGSDTVVAMTLTNTNGAAPEAKHYELFAIVHGGAVSLQKFDIRFRTLGDGAYEKAVLDHLDPSRQLGIVDGFEKPPRPVGGIRFSVPVNLTDAIQLFISIEDDGDTDPVPSLNILMACELESLSRGTLSCLLGSTDDKDVVLGSAALVLPDDGINGF
jgi:hypothetical protein